ncbi:polysaccharide biosynthesis protein [Deferribacter autotrophicus]|uniref:Polysaccharide biosynthesis protein n=1 Tax=Deferribacter autotrophicus TaxID=500465 RepID=A0A5A8F144_9BACT|nr:oligosaccharide flippase family protein [Deferribacter autotrophicus]KAA0257630.1 polysaccharide biosynthesis protein [Deferribacter autotrophicus]
MNNIRTINYIKQVKYSFVLKFLTIGCSFLSIPIMIKYLGTELYGIWSTLLSITSWIVLMDFGIGNGLKNKVVESLALNSRILARKYISTSYIIIGFVSISLILFIVLISQFIPWQKVFNTNLLSNDEITKVVNITFIFISLNFWVSLINQVFNGLQKTSLVNLNQFLSNFIILVSVYALYKTTSQSFHKLAFLYGLSLVLPNIILSIWFYRKNSLLIPRPLDFSLKKAKEIISLGTKFFIIQIAVIIIFTTDKILITQLFEPAKVAEYEVVFKLFSIVILIHSLISAPLWPAYADAYHKKDFKWISTNIKKQLSLFFYLILLTLTLLITAKFIISLWVGADFNVETGLLIVMGIFTIVSTWNNIFAFFINATNQLNIQIITSLIAIVINIPLSIFIVKFFNTDSYGIVIGTIISLMFFAILGPIQTYKIIRGNLNVE